MKQFESALTEPITSQTVSEQVYNKIKSAILTGEFAPGSRIVQENITQQLNVSRTPVREALQRLSSEGLVTLKPFYGAQVFNLSIENLHEIYDIRILIESYAARKSCFLLSDSDIDELEEMNNLIRDKPNSIQDCMAYDRSFHQAICFASFVEIKDQFNDHFNTPYEDKLQLILVNYHDGQLWFNESLKIDLEENLDANYAKIREIMEFVTKECRSEHEVAPIAAKLKLGHLKNVIKGITISDAISTVIGIAGLKV